MRRKFLRPEDYGHILTRFKELRRQSLGIMECCEIIGGEIGREPQTVYAAVKRLTPTTELSATYFKANAFRLAARIVRNANVQEAIDILSRTNVGVLAPKTEGGGGPGGFFLSVTAETCGAVKIGVAHAAGTGSQVSLPEGDQDPFGLQGGPSHRGEEHGDRGDTHPRGISAGQSQEDAAVQTIDVIAETESLNEERQPDQLIESPHQPEAKVRHQGHIGRFAGEARESWSPRVHATINAAKSRIKAQERKRRRQRLIGGAQAEDQESHQQEPEVAGGRE